MNSEDQKLRELFLNAEFDEIDLIGHDNFASKLNAKINDGHKNKQYFIEAAQYLAFAFVLAFGLLLLSGSLTLKTPDLSQYIERVPILSPELLVYALIALISISALTLANQE